MKRILSIILTLIVIGTCALGQRTNTTRKLSNTKTVQSSNGISIGVDTIQCQPEDLTFTGYEKVLRSNWESVFVTNNTADTVRQVSMTIDYFDMDNRQLHQRTETVQTIIPPSETRQIQFSSWDKNKVMYYYRSEATRTSSQATPYRVLINPTAYLREKKTE